MKPRQWMCEFRDPDQLGELACFACGGVRFRHDEADDVVFELEHCACSCHEGGNRCVCLEDETWDQPVHKDDCLVASRGDRSGALMRAHQWLRDSCAAAGHYPENPMNVGLGNGALDFFCVNCGGRIRSVSVHTATGEELKIAIRLGVRYAQLVP